MLHDFQPRWLAHVLPRCLHQQMCPAYRTLALMHSSLGDEWCAKSALIAFLAISVVCLVIGIGNRKKPLLLPVEFATKALRARKTQIVAVDQLSHYVQTGSFFADRAERYEVIGVETSRERPRSIEARWEFDVRGLKGRLKRCLHGELIEAEQPTRDARNTSIATAAVA